MQKLKEKYNILIKKSIVILLLISNLSFILPNFSFAADEEEDEDVKYPALVPMAADSIISKYVNTSFDGSSSASSSGTTNVNDYAEERRWILFSYRS